MAISINDRRKLPTELIDNGLGINFPLLSTYTRDGLIYNFFWRSDPDMFNLLCYAVLPVVALYTYIVLNDNKLCQLPPEAEVFSPDRLTPQDAVAAFKKLQEKPVDISDFLPPKTGRRYIVVGGVSIHYYQVHRVSCNADIHQTGFLGGWIVLQLLQRGEDPKRIRVLDLRPPTRPDLRAGQARHVAFFKVDISDAKAVSEAFHAPWPEMDPPENIEVTVFHSAANIKFYERFLALLPYSTKVNHEGTKNIIASSGGISASILIYTSSASIAVRRTRFLLWPWEKHPSSFVQLFSDNDVVCPKNHDYFSNYAASKMLGERAVCEANGSKSGPSSLLRTGCIRPGNGIFGPGGDLVCGAYLVRQHNPTWVAHILNSFIYVENCALAHLCYEQRLIELEKGVGNPDIAGEAFNVTDAGPPCTFGDNYVALSTLDDKCKFPRYSMTFMLLIAHIVEAIYTTRILLLSSNLSICRVLGRMIPAITGDLANLQPSMFALTSIHLVFDDSRARLPPSEGGLGYRGPYTTLQGVCKTVDAHLKADGDGEERSRSGGISFNLKTSRSMEKVHSKRREPLQMDAMSVPN